MARGARRRREVKAGDALPRAQLEDHLSAWLSAVADLLAAAPGVKRELSDDQHSQDAEIHGLQRRQQAAHDLRGNLGVVSNVAQGLTFADLPATRRHDVLRLLRNNVTSLHHLLDDVTSLARLQAGQEQRRIGPFDAAAELRRLAGELRPLTENKGLTLTADGPDTLPVDGDVVKVRRIAQNLLLNALENARTSGVAASRCPGTTALLVIVRDGASTPSRAGSRRCTSRCRSAIRRRLRRPDPRRHAAQARAVQSVAIALPGFTVPDESAHSPRPNSHHTRSKR